MSSWVAGCVVLLLLTVANARSNTGSQLQPEPYPSQGRKTERTLSQASSTQRVLTEGPHLQRYQSFLERNPKFHSKLSEAFKDLDANHDGRLSRAELQHALEHKALTPMDYHLVQGFDVNNDGHVSAQEFQYGPMFVSVLEMHPELSEEFADKASSGADSVPDLRSFFQSALEPENQSNLRSLVQQHKSRVRAAKGNTHVRTQSHRNAGGLPGEALAFLELEAMGAGEIVTVSARGIPAGPATLLEAESSTSTSTSSASSKRNDAEPDWSELDRELDPMSHVEADEVSKFDEHELRDVLMNSRISPDITRPSSWKTDKPGFVEPTFVPGDSTMHVEQRLEAERWSGAGGNANTRAKQVKMIKDQVGLKAAKQQQLGRAGLQPAIVEPLATPITGDSNAEEERFGQVRVQQGQKKFIGNLVKAVGGAVSGAVKMATGALTGTKPTDKSSAQAAQDAAKPQSKFGVPAYEDEKCIICQYAMQRVRHNLYSRLTNDPNESVASGTPDAMAMRDVNSQVMNRFGGKGLLRIVFEDTIDNLCSSESMPELFYAHCQELTKEKKTLLKALFFQYNADAACEEANLCTQQSYFAKDTAVHLPDMSKKFNSGRGTCGMRGGAHERGGAFGGLMCAGSKMFMK